VNAWLIDKKGRGQQSGEEKKCAQFSVVRNHGLGPCEIGCERMIEPAERGDLLEGCECGKCEKKESAYF